MAAGASKKTFEGDLFVDALPVHWIRNGPLRNRPVFLFAHGAGAPQTSSFMEMVALGLLERGVTVVRFNFPYMERAVREGKRRPPDAKGRLLKTCATLFDFVVDQLPQAQRQRPPLVVGGKSMGGRMMSMLAAGEATTATEEATPGKTANPAALVYFGYPLHPPGKPTSLRTTHLASIRPPQLFISGTRDALAHVEILEDSLQKLPRVPKLHLVEGGDHSLTTNRKDPARGSEAWLDVAADFILRHTRARLPQK